MARQSSRDSVRVWAALICLIVLGAVAAVVTVRLLSDQTAVPTARAAGLDLSRGEPLPLRKATDQAASIWRGTVAAVARATGETRLGGAAGEVLLARTDRARFRIERVLKGRRASGVRTIPVYTTPDSRFFPGLEAGQHGLVFLDSRGMVLDPARPIVLLGPGGLEGPPGDDPLEAVKQEMIFSLRPDAPARALHVQELAQQFHVDPAAIEPALRRVALSPDDEVAAVGLRGLARHPTPSSVRAAVKAALARASNPGPYTRSALGRLGDLHDPSLAPVIVPLLETDVPEWRRAALSALASMRADDYVHCLADALDEDDPRTQYRAVRGLVWMIEARDQNWPGPDFGYQEFLRNRDAHIAMWKHWWESEGRAKYGKK